MSFSKVGDLSEQVSMFSFVWNLKLAAFFYFFFIFWIKRMIPHFCQLSPNILCLSIRSCRLVYYHLFIQLILFRLTVLYFPHCSMWTPYGKFLSDYFSPWTTVSSWNYMEDGNIRQTWRTWKDRCRGYIFFLRSSTSLSAPRSWAIWTISKGSLLPVGINQWEAPENDQKAREQLD